MISRIFSGSERGSITTYLRIASALGITVDRLIRTPAIWGRVRPDQA
jgi:transcriptional regulator with XRE-family HTH domain